MLLLNTSRRKKHARDDQFMFQKIRSATWIDTSSAATRARHSPKSRSAMLHTSRHCARPGAVDLYTRSYKDLVAYVDLRSFLWLPRQTLREKGLYPTPPGIGRCTDTVWVLASRLLLPYTIPWHCTRTGICLFLTDLAIARRSPSYMYAIASLARSR